MKNIKLITFLLALDGLVLDRVAKYLFQTNLDWVVPGWLGIGFRMVINTGVVFGLMPGWGLLMSLAGFIIFLCFVFWYRSFLLKNTLLWYGVWLIVFGALSNLIDRLFFGGVVDYIDVKWYSVFNIADVMVVLGTVILLYGLGKGGEIKNY